MTRLLWETRLARRLPVEARSAQLRRILARLGEIDGEGLYLSVRTEDDDAAAQGLRDRGIGVGRATDGALLIVPPLDMDDGELARLEAAVSQMASANSGAAS